MAKNDIFKKGNKGGINPDIPPELKTGDEVYHFFTLRYDGRCRRGLSDFNSFLLLHAMNLKFIKADTIIIRNKVEIQRTQKKKFMLMY